MPFLKPTGVDSPLAISRCVWDSVVRAPIAVQLISSDRYCGMIGSSASVAAGNPISARSSSSPRARRDPFLDVKGIVHERIVDEPLPSHRRPRLLEIDAHQQQHRRGDTGRELLEPAGVLARRLEIVDRARPDDDEESRIAAIEDRANGRSAAIDRLLRLRRQGQRAFDLLGRRQELARNDVDVGQAIVFFSSTWMQIV